MFSRPLENEIRRALGGARNGLLSAGEKVTASESVKDRSLES